jgi:hypothetical protein
MGALRLSAKLTIYYLVVAALVWAALSLFPPMRDFLPVGSVETLITQPDKGLLEGNQTPPAQVKSMAESLVWLVSAILAALLTSIPVSLTYMAVRSGDEYDQSLVDTILVLPMVVTSIVIVVQNSLALAFTLGGIAGAVRFRNSLKSSGDALFILLSVGIGLAAGSGAVELAIVMSIAFNYCFLILWWSEFGERAGMKRYLSDFRPHDAASELPPPPLPPITPSEPGA